MRSCLQGIGRHSDGDRRAMVAEELAALAALLGDRPYMFGDKCAHIALVAHSAASWCIASCPAADATAWMQPTLLPLPAFSLSGCSPHAVDASVYGVLDQMAAAAMNPRLAALVAAHPNLVRCVPPSCAANNMPR